VSKGGEPVTVTGHVLAVSDGTYRAGSGTLARMGLTGVIAIGSIRLCIRSLPSSEWDPAMYSSLGLSLSDAALIFVKSPSHFRATFGRLADRLLIADTPGATCPNLRRVPFQNVTRPLYPLDPL
jgi:microcystin degradation protein MlrC